MNEMTSAGREIVKERGMANLTVDELYKELTPNGRSTVRERGVENLTVDELLNEVTPKAKELIPDSVKQELQQQLQGYF
ncbi:transcription and mRNA export factor ENY2-2-like [Stegodyphus dumicola]|uniref:transcription and mRNA export factor ENY2-2-like n=1 Tax=Stegodyphus dumicola TaxID=202533 RepID=UPI0015AD008A|nr:transcription and mRNA export factor ENY2-2-like [Stegodyphus dumicola]